jgi:hypothetical protein
VGNYSTRPEPDPLSFLFAAVASMAEVLGAVSVVEAASSVARHVSYVASMAEAELIWA